MSAAWSTGYENRPSFSFDLLPPAKGEALGSTDSFDCGCYEHGEAAAADGSSLHTFHCVIRDKYPTDAVQLKIHINSACAETWIHCKRRM